MEKHTYCGLGYSKVGALLLMSSFLKHSTSNWCLFCSLQGNSQVLYINLFVFLRSFQWVTDCFSSPHAYKVILLTTMMLLGCSSFDHLTSDWCSLSLIQDNTQVLYINVFVFHSTFQLTIDHFWTWNGSKVILITMTMVQFFNSLTLFSFNKINFKIVLNNVDSPSSLLIQSNAHPWVFNLPLLAKSLFHYLWQSWLHSKKVINSLVSTNLNHRLIPQATGWRIPLAKLPSHFFSSTYSILSCVIDYLTQLQWKSHLPSTNAWSWINPTCQYLGRIIGYSQYLGCIPLYRGFIASCRLSYTIILVRRSQS